MLSLIMYGENGVKKYIEVGKIVSTHGIRGEVNVYPWCDSAELITTLKYLYIKGGSVQFEVERAFTSRSMAVVKLSGINTVEEAKEYKNYVLYAKRDDISLPEGTFFIADLISLSVVDHETGEEYGTISDVTQTGANDVYHVKRNDGREFLIPAIKDVIKETDIENGIMKISLLAGLLDDED